MSNMSSSTALLLLGSNLGNKKENLSTAISNIKTEIGEIIRIGEIIETEPVEFTSTDMFLNQLLEVKTQLSPMQLLRKIKEIEAIMGRTYPKPLPNEHYTSRTIDIDILQMDNLHYTSKKLNIPHNQIHTRIFVQQMINSYNAI